MSCFNFYAELLPFIKSISLSIHLDTPSDLATRAVLAPDGYSVLFQHSGETSPLILPARVGIDSQHILSNLPLGKTDLSYRLPADSSSIPSGESENYTPWSASELTAIGRRVRFCCRSCGLAVIECGQVLQWKDLPSSNWAELMDFWHCHKPHAKGGGGTDSKYAAYGKGFALEEGTGLVEGGYFLFSPKDCRDVKVTDPLPEGGTKSRLVCAKCDAPLGAVEKDLKKYETEAWRLNKWTLRLNCDDLEVAYPLECFLSAQLISLVENNGTRRLLVSSEDETSLRLKVWVFNTDIRYTHSLTAREIRGLKIFYSLVDPQEEVATGSLKNMGFEAVVLEPAVYDTLRERLEASTKCLCPDLRILGDWTGGALRRFDHSQ